MAHSVRRLARGTTQKLTTYAGPVGELCVDTDTNELVLQTGRPGGVRFSSGSGGGGSSSGGTYSPVSVSTFGAKGDGVTDDTAAFEAALAASDGRGVYVPPGTYNVSKKIDGYFWSDVPVVIPYTRVWCQGYYDFSPRSFNGGAVSSVGGDNFGISGLEYGQSDRAAQAPCCDVLDGIIYMPQQTSEGQSWVKVIKWSESESERTLLKESNKVYGLTGHQSLNIYRPMRSMPVKLVITRNTYTAANSADQSRALTIGIFDFDYKTDSVPTESRVLQAFSSSDVTQYGLDRDPASHLMSTAVSPDGAVLVAMAYSLTNKKWVFRVWDMHAVMMGKITDSAFPTSAMYTWVEPENSQSAGGQGVWTDGRYIYAMSGASALASFSTDGVRAAIIATWTLDGKFLGFNMIDTTYAAKAFDGNGTFGKKRSICEFEGMFLAPWYGKLVPVLISSFMRYDTDGSSDYKRFNRYAIPSEAHVSSQVPATRELILEGDLRVLYNSTFANTDSELMTQSILSYAPAGDKDVNICFGGQAGTYIVAGETGVRIRERLQEMSVAGTVKGSENLHLFADSVISMTAGCNEAVDGMDNAGAYFLSENGTLDGFHINAAQNFFFRKENPIVTMQYSGYTKGTTIDKNYYSRLSWQAAGSNLGLSANTDYNLLTMQHNLYTSNSTWYQRFFITMYNCMTVSSANEINAISIAELKDSSDSANGFLLQTQMDFAPWNSGTFELGTESLRWKNIYLSNSPNVGSDIRDKKDIADLTDVERQVAAQCKSLFKKYRLANDADNFIHVGAIAQDIKTAFESYGLDATKYNIIRYDQKTDRYSLCYTELICFVISAL